MIYYKPQWLIKIQNRVNKVTNTIVNNPISNCIKEAFYSLNFPYQEYLFSDDGEDYLVDYKKGKTEDGKIIVEFRTTPELKYALDVSKMIIFKKYYVKYVINRTSKEYGRRGDFRFKRYLIYN